VWELDGIFVREPEGGKGVRFSEDQGLIYRRGKKKRKGGGARKGGVTSDWRGEKK